MDPIPHTPPTPTTARWPIAIAVAVIAVVFLLRIPSIVQPMGPDQGVYTTIGWALQHGLDLYRDLFEQKLPGIYLAYLLSFLIIGNRPEAIFALDFTAGLITVIAVWGIGARLVNARFGGLAAACVAWATMPAARHGLGGFLERAVTETFVMPLAAVATLCAVVAWQRERRDLVVLAGLLIGTAAVFKQTALIYWPALIVWTWMVSDTRQAIRFGVHALSGLVVVPLLVFAWLWSRGVLGDMWIATVEFNMAYVAVGDHGFGYSVTQYARAVFQRIKTDEIWALGCLAAGVAALSWRWRASPSGRAGLLGVIWLCAAGIATLANGPRFFTTYFMPSLVPLSLLIAWLLYQTLGSAERRRHVAGVVVVLIAVVMLTRSHVVTRAIASTSWDTRHLFGSLERDAYLERFRSRATRAFHAGDNAQLAEYLQARTGPEDRLFVFGMTAGTYFSSQRLPAVRYLWAYAPVSEMIDRPEFTVEHLAAELTRTSPAYIVLQPSNGDSFSGWRASEAFQAEPLQALIRARYDEETTIGDFVVYRRRD